MIQSSSGQELRKLCTEVSLTLDDVRKTLSYETPDVQESLRQIEGRKERWVSTISHAAECIEQLNGYCAGLTQGMNQVRETIGSLDRLIRNAIITKHNRTFRERHKVKRKAKRK